MADAPDVGKPSSGSYGEGADLARLKAALPPGAIGNPAPAPKPAPLPPISGKPMVKPTAPQGRPPTGAAAPPGLPSVLLHPPVPQAPDQPPPPGSQATPDQGRLALLYALQSAQDVSPETREWAGHVIDILLTRGR